MRSIPMQFWPMFWLLGRELVKHDIEIGLFLQDTTHECARPLLQVSVGENNSRVLSTKFEGDRGQVLSSIQSNL